MKGFIAFFLIAVISYGCAGKSGNSNDLSDIKPTPTPVTASRPIADVSLKAEAEGNLVFVHIKNNTLDSLRISPFFFALIIDNKRPEIRYQPSMAQAELPATKLSKGVEVSGKFRFFNYDNLVGQKLVFNSPDYKPVMVYIEDYIAE